MENDIIKRSPHKREHCTSFSRNDGYSKSFSYFNHTATETGTHIYTPTLIDSYTHP